MSSVLTNKFRIHNAKSFVEGFSEAEPTNIYTTIGKVTPWSSNDLYSGANENTSDTNPPTPLDHVQNEYEVWRNMLAAKKIKPTDVTHVIPKVDWEPEKIYSQYGDLDATLLYDIINDSTPKPFYVMTDEFNVYKCLFNNNIESMVKPTGTGTGAITTSDGYIWKYMYTVTPSSAFRFMTENFIPIQTLTEDPQSGSHCSSPSLQWEVQEDARLYGEGRIDVIARRYGSAFSSGSGYVSASGNIISATYDSLNDETTIIVNGSLTPSSNNYYDGMTLYYASLGTAFLIKTFTSGGNDTILVDGDASAAGGTLFDILPTVVVEGDGTGLQAVPVMGSPDNASDADQIDSVKVLNGGSGYTTASVSFVNAPSVTPTDAQFDVIIPPVGGHGRDAIEELGGFFVMVNTKFEYAESNLTVSNDYRQISLIRQPKETTVDNPDATKDLYIQSKTLVVSVAEISGDFLPDEIVTQAGTNATGIIVDVLDDAINNNKEIRIVNFTGTFDTSNPISSSGTGSANLVSSIVDEELLKNSGDVMFVEQRSNIIRDETQIEDIKIVLEF